MEKSNLISIVIPVYMNEREITNTYVALHEVFTKKLVGFSFEVIFVNDGSKDNSLAEIKELAGTKNNVSYISFSRNFGQVPAIIAGLQRVKGDGAIVMSADLQDPPELIVKMVEEWREGNEIVICNRIEREDNFTSRITSAFFYNLIKLSNPKMPKGGFDFVFLGPKAINEFNKINEKNRFFQGDILWLGFSIKFLPYTRMKRQIGKSQWTFSKKIKYFLDGLLNTSYAPIRLFSLLGLFISFLGFIYSIIIFYNRIINNIPFKGWAPIMMVLLFIGGILMLMLGIIGEYIWRIYDETRKRSMYIIDENSYED